MRPDGTSKASGRTARLRAHLSSSATPLKRVVIVGGTHGNEFTGVAVVKRLQQSAFKLLAGLSSLDISALIANPAALQANRRFVEDDLNRQFTSERLAATGRLTVEQRRARELDALLGPKLSASPAVGLVVDLHTTTANMGTVLILHDESAVTLRAAAYAQRLLGGEASGVRILLEQIVARDACPYLSSAGRFGMEIEVGPTPQGVIRHDVVASTEAALRAVLDYVHRANLGGGDAALEKVGLKSGEIISVYRTIEDRLAWPVDPEDGFPAAVVHRSLQDRDWHPLRTGDAIFERLDTGEMIAYDGAQGDGIVPIFVNEGGYYYAQSGAGINLARREAIPIPLQD